MSREGVKVACCTVERLLKRSGLQKARRGKAVRTTVPDQVLPCPLDRMNRQFKADRPNQRRASDFTYVSTLRGWQYLAFLINAHAQRFMGWCVSSSIRTYFVLDALEQALYDRQPDQNALIHHSDRGTRDVSIFYRERLAQVGIEPSLGSRGDSDDNALVKAINRLYRTKLIHRAVPLGKRGSHLELASLKWVSWFNHHRLL